MEVSNYIKMRDQMQERFLTYDQKGSMALPLMTIISMCRTFLRSGE